MNILEWSDLEDGKAYWKHHVDSGATVMCEAFEDGNEIGLMFVDDTDEYEASEFRDCVFMEIEKPPRSDWALAILQKDSQ